MSYEGVTKIVEHDPNGNMFRWSGYIKDGNGAVIGSRFNCAATKWGMNRQLNKGIRRYTRNLRKHNAKQKWVTHVDISGKV